MSRFQKQAQKLGYRTNDFFKGKSVAQKNQPRPQKMRFTQHKG